MKSKIKKGGEYLFSQGESNKWDKLTDKMIINFIDKCTYQSFEQKRNHLLIQTTEGTVDIVFTSEVPKLTFKSYCKDQLVLTITV